MRDIVEALVLGALPQQQMAEENCVNLDTVTLEPGKCLCFSDLVSQLSTL